MVIRGGAWSRVRTVIFGFERMRAQPEGPREDGKVITIPRACHRCKGSRNLPGDLSWCWVCQGRGCSAADILAATIVDDGWWGDIATNTETQSVRASSQLETAIAGEIDATDCAQG